MSRAAKLVASFLRPVADALRPLRTRFDKYWDVDNRASNFYTQTEWDAIQEERKKKWDGRMKDNFFTHVRTNMASRVKIDLLADSPFVRLDKPKGVKGDLATK